MASILKVDKLDPQSGTALEIGTSGDTITVPSGATLDISSATLTPPATLPASSGVNLTALNATNLGSGTVPTARLGTGTASSSTVLYGDQTYKAEPGGGKIGQVVSAITTGAVTTSSTSFVTTGLGVTVPSLAATSSKVLIQVDSPLCYEDNSPNSYVFCTLYANIDSAGNVDLGNGSNGFTGFYESGITYDDLGWNASFNFLHSPSTTADVVYTVMFRSSVGTASYIWNLEGQGTITAMEVLA